MKIFHNQTSFWKDNNYPYFKAVEITEPELMQLTVVLSRNDIIEWLMWNDRNGVYSDEDSFREFDAVMTREEGLEIMLRQIAENRLPEK